MPGVIMAINNALRPWLTMIVAVAGVMFLADLLVATHIMALEHYLDSTGVLLYWAIALRFVSAALIISAVAFTAGLLFCMYRRPAWYAAALCLAAMLLFQVNVYFTDYSLYGLIDAALFFLPRLLLIFCLLFAAVPILAAACADLGSRLHARIGEKIKCAKQV
jgi:hypothetical protein